MNFKVSIITVSYNSEKTIESTVQSVLKQDYNNIEYIIIDGNSHDKTLEIISKYSDKISKIVSEPDEGIYDAMNIGLSHASGDIIVFLNSDDFYQEENAISNVMEIFNSQNPEVVYGDIIYITNENSAKVKRYWSSGLFSSRKISYGLMPPHSAFFCKRNLFLKYGNFNKKLKIAADYDLMLRFLIQLKENEIIYLNKVITIMRDGGVSNKSIFHVFRANKEVFYSLKECKIHYSFFVVLIKIFRKIPQLFSCNEALNNIEKNIKINSLK